MDRLILPEEPPTDVRYRRGDSLVRYIRTVSKSYAHQRRLKPGPQFGLCGIVNSDVKVYENSNCKVFRVPIITWDFMQIIVDISCENESQEPKYDSDWKLLQWTIIKGASFQSKFRSYGIDIYYFKVNANYKEDRFIWISVPDEIFWQSGKDDKEILNRSEGSCFGDSVSQMDRTIHSHDKIDGFVFSLHKERALKYKSKVQEQLPEKVPNDMFSFTNVIMFVNQNPMLGIKNWNGPIFHRYLINDK